MKHVNKFVYASTIILVVLMLACQSLRVYQVLLLTILHVYLPLQKTIVSWMDWTASIGWLFTHVS